MVLSRKLGEMRVPLQTGNTTVLPALTLRSVLTMNLISFYSQFIVKIQANRSWKGFHGNLYADSLKFISNFID